MNKLKRNLRLLGVAAVFCGALGILRAGEDPGVYVCQRKDGDLVLDGKIDKPIWKNKQVARVFYKSKDKGLAKYQTEVYAMWDDDNLYIAAKMQDEDIVGLFKQRDDPIYKEDAFEVFFRPDPNATYIYEFEISPAGVIWDGLNKRTLNPYASDRSPEATKAWNAEGLQSAVHLEGTLNDSKDKDKFWSVEVKIPFKIFSEAAKVPPEKGTAWPIVFARCESSVYVEKKVEWSANIPLLKYGEWENYVEWGKLLFSR